MYKNFNEEKSVYIQLKDGFEANCGQKMYVKDLATILVESDLKKSIEDIEVVESNENESLHMVVTIFMIIEKITQRYPTAKVFPIGNTEILINIIKKGENDNKIWLFFRLFIVSLVLFVGAGLALMNFHADVNMNEVHAKIYKMITGMDEKRPLILQIPYSLGIGLGMAMFFNHIIPRKFGNEPSPMEVEMSSYRKKMDGFIKKHNNKK